MASVDSALAGVEERDKWLRRLRVLERALEELLDKRRKVEVRLRKVRHELHRLEQTSKEFVEMRARPLTTEVRGVPHGPFFR